MIELDFVNCLFYIEYLKVISSEMKQLKTLKIYTSFLGEEGAKEISTMKSLETLHLFSTNIGDKGVSHIVDSMKSQLVELSIPSNKITSIGAELIGNSLHNLTYLNIGRNSIENEGVKSISNLKKLRELVAYYIGITCEGVVFIASIPALTLLDLHRNEIKGSIPIICGMKQLTSLNLSDNAYVIKQSDLIGLKSLPNLTELILDDMSLGNGIFGTFEQMNQLKSLSMKRSCMGFLTQVTLPELTSLNLSASSIGCIGIDNLCSLSNLTSLEIEHNNIEDVGLKLISNFMRKLVTLNVCYNKLSDSSLSDTVLPRLERSQAVF